MHFNELPQDIYYPLLEAAAETATCPKDLTAFTSTCKTLHEIYLSRKGQLQTLLLRSLASSNYEDLLSLHPPSTSFLTLLESHRDLTSLSTFLALLHQTLGPSPSCGSALHPTALRTHPLRPEKTLSATYLFAKRGIRSVPRLDGSEPGSFTGGWMAHFASEQRAEDELIEWRAVRRWMRMGYTEMTTGLQHAGERRRAVYKNRAMSRLLDCKKGAWRDWALMVRPDESWVQVLRDMDEDESDEVRDELVKEYAAFLQSTGTERFIWWAEGLDGE